MTWKVGTKINFLMYDYLSSPSSRFLHLVCERIVWRLSGSPSLEKVQCDSQAALLLRYAHTLALAFKQSSLDRGQEEVSLEKPVWFCILRKQCALYCENKVLLPHTSPWEVPRLLHKRVSPNCTQSDRAIHPREPQGRSKWGTVEERLVLQRLGEQYS